MTLFVLRPPLEVGVFVSRKEADLLQRSFEQRSSKRIYFISSIKQQLTVLISVAYGIHFYSFTHTRKL